jgi:hypothetical protein
VNQGVALMIKKMMAKVNTAQVARIELSLMDLPLVSSRLPKNRSWSQQLH